VNFSIRTVKESEGIEAIWRRLAPYQDVSRITARLMAQRKIEGDQNKNVQKQVEQLAFSLTQAKEYFRSAEISGPTTRALMAYYGLIALANAEILWRGDGMSSFEKRNGRFNAHGLELVHDKDVGQFGARPSPGVPGLYGLWRSFATHIPHYSSRTIRHGNTGSTETVDTTSTVTKLCDLPSRSDTMSLLDCLKHIPAMRNALDTYGEETKLCRGSISESLTLDDSGVLNTRTRTYTFHHITDEHLDDVGSKFLISPRSVPEFEIGRVSTGLGVVWRADLQTPGGSLFAMPEIFADSANEVHFVGSGDHLNEFGYYYTALFIAGMLTRYYPHIWIRELRANSKTATLIDDLVHNALIRVPLLTASALEERVYIYV